MILVKENVNNVSEFNYLYDAVGWGIMIMKFQKKL